MQTFNLSQQDIAILLQEKADKKQFKDSGQLAKHASYLGASYKVLAWVDSYCLSRNLYTNEVK